MRLVRATVIVLILAALATHAYLVQRDLAYMVRVTRESDEFLRAMDQTFSDMCAERARKGSM